MPVELKLFMLGLRRGVEVCGREGEAQSCMVKLQLVPGIGWVHTAHVHTVNNSRTVQYEHLSSQNLILSNPRNLKMNCEYRG